MKESQELMLIWLLHGYSLVAADVRNGILVVHWQYFVVLFNRLACQASLNNLPAQG